MSFWQTLNKIVSQAVEDMNELSKYTAGMDEAQTRLFVKCVYEERKDNPNLSHEDYMRIRKEVML